MDRPNIYLMLLSCILFIINRFDYNYKLKKNHGLAVAHPHLLICIKIRAGNRYCILALTKYETIHKLSKWIKYISYLSFHNTSYLDEYLYLTN